MAKEKDEFNLIENPEVVDNEISKDDFKFVQQDKTIHDQKFQTKPTTFFKDSLKRFSKNKSSVVAAIVLGGLFLLSLVIPIIGQVSPIHSSKGYNGIDYLEPKLFKAGTGFWDGTKKLKGIPVDISADPEGLDKENNWWPDPENYKNRDAIIKGSKVFTDETYTDEATAYGKGGFVQIGYYNNISDETEYVYMETPKIEQLDLKSTYTLNKFDVYDMEKLANSNEEKKTFPENYVEAESALYFTFGKKGEEPNSFVLVDYAKKHDIGVTEPEVNLTEKIKEVLVNEEVYSEAAVDNAVLANFRFEFRVKNQLDKLNNCTLVKQIVFTTDSNDPQFKSLFEAPSFTSGNDVMIRKSDSTGYWTSYTPAVRKTYLSKAVLCDFVYDTYENAFGHKWEDQFPVTTFLDVYKKNGYINFSYEPEFDHMEGTKPVYVIKEGTWNFEILNAKKVAIAEEGIEEKNVKLDEFGEISRISCYVMKYKMDPYNLESMPKFLLGTDKNGRDMLVYVFEGVRYSLLLGIGTTIVCFLFGLIWGSIAGYFGGTVDLVMERFTDILAGIPWIVVMTLVIINLGSNFGTFALALCMTGWIGTAATTRTQFYRFRGREYVLASRTLGASSGRLIAKHILPNAMGTIITSAVLMVPSVIFSEATISFLGLGFANMSSLGVILSDVQKSNELTNHPFLLIFPSVIIALLMISFNLFGNGLRDAVNPSLKGEGE